MERKLLMRTLWTGAIEQRPETLRHPHELLLDHTETPLHLSIPRQLLLQELHVRGREIEWRAELMRDVGHRLTDGCQLADRPQLLGHAGVLPFKTCKQDENHDGHARDGKCRDQRRQQTSIVAK